MFRLTKTPLRQYSNVISNINSGNKPTIVISGEMDMRLLLSVGMHLFKQSTNKPSLFIARSSPSVIIGRNQNPYIECKLDAMKQDNINLIRRETGGGAIYGDNGTMMVGFYGNTDYPNFNKQNIDGIILKSFNEFIKYPAELVGKNDIKVLIPGDENYYKIAGQAYKLHDNQYLHHFAGSVDTRMDKLQEYLNPNKLKMQSKATTSVRSHVKNMLEIALYPNHNREDMCYNISMALINNFMNHYKFVDANIIMIDSMNKPYLDKFSHLKPSITTSEKLLEVDDIASSFNKLCDYNWTFGNIPEFTHSFEGRFNWGTVKINFNVKNNIIENVACYTDSIYVDIPDVLQQILKGKSYGKQAITTELGSYLCDREYMIPILGDIKNMIVNDMHDIV